MITERFVPKRQFHYGCHNKPSIKYIHCQCLLLALVSALINVHAVDGKICTSIDIRNSPSYFTKLEDCSVIEGHMKIILIENATAAAYNYSFPALREITDYLLLFRVNGLQSTARMFPNLAVIRGRNLFSDYALVVYEMSELQELGMTNLTVIERGGVRIHKNPQLCFADTIDWGQIAKNGDIYVKDNNPNECPRCSPVGRKCPTDPRPTSGLSSSQPRTAELCWTTDTCQRVCAHNCNSTCMVDNTDVCCHAQCLGGCFGPGDTQCVACKKMVETGPDGVERCKAKCSDGMYEFMERRCISQIECQQMSMLPRVDSPPGGYKLFKPHGQNGTWACLPECPAGHEPDANNECRMCRESQCPKRCEGGKITNVAEAQKYRGCTIIEGSLEISVSKHSANIADELTAALEHIQEIKNYLKIIRSNSLVSLYFFKNLRKIGGEVLDRSEYAISILDNMNLQELFPYGAWGANPNRFNKLLSVPKGRLFVHMNPKLCLSKIYAVKNFSDIVELRDKPWDQLDRDVSLNTNGDRIACHVANLQLTITRIYQNRVDITFRNFQKQLADFRQLLGYFIYYREASQNVTMFDGVDACGATSWMVEDREVSDSRRDERNMINETIKDLKPFTRYAMYIKTYTVSTEREGGVTEIIYFRTKPASK